MTKKSPYRVLLRISLLTFFAIAMAGLPGCASAPKDTAARAEFEKDNDPIEPFNRAMFAFNKQMDGMFLRPAAVVYKAVLPQPVQKGVHNFLSNLRAPVVLTNDLLQWEMDRAGNTAGRFVINTTVGVLGVWDAAAYMGIEGHSEDFGQTFGSWGIGEGFYLVLPFLGPSNPRDAVGLVTEYFADPVHMWIRNGDYQEMIFVRAMVTGVDFRARNLQTIDELERTSLDYYTAVRSLYRQRRIDEISNGKGTADQLAPGITFEPKHKKNTTDGKSARAE
jgi:phospholipid-binding lipoprotein MlaA